MSIERSWVKVGAICGLFSAGFYMLLNIPNLPIPTVMIRVIFFAVGVLGVISVGGLYHLIKKHRNSVMLQQAVLLSIIAFVLLALMAVSQETIEAFRAESISVAQGEQARELQVNIWKAVDSVQLAMDIAFDIFYTLTFIFYSILMFRHPRFGKIFGVSGVLIFSLLLLFNLYSFPHPPASNGLIDLGPITGLWSLAVIIQSLRSLKWMDS